jgi:hypothetical protein
MYKKRTSGFRKLAGSILFLFVSAGIFAQTDFSGNWVFNQSKSVFTQGPDGQGGGPGGQGGPMGGGGITVTQDSKTLTVNQTMQSPDGEMKITSKYNLDSTVSENTMFMDMKSKSTLTWSADKKSIAIVSTMVFDMGGESREMKTTETWKLSDDGKTLLIESVMPGPPGGGEGGQPSGSEGMKITRAYDKK